MKHALVTGGSGFIGSHLSSKLLEEGYRVTIVDNFSRGVRDKELEDLLEKDNVSLIEVNLLEPDLNESLPKDVDFIFHCAAIVGVQNVVNNPFAVLSNNHLLLENIIRYAKELKKLESLIFFSTSEVYAAGLSKIPDVFPTPETHTLVVPSPEEARSTYALSKIYGEALCFASGLPFLVVRPHNIYGPRMGNAHVIPQLTERIVNANANESEVEVFSPEHTRTFCYIDDATEYLIRLIENRNTYGKIFNLGVSEPECSVMDLAKLIKKITHSKAQLLEGEVTPGSPTRRVPCTKKIYKATDYLPKVTFEQGVTKTVQWYQDKII